MAVCGKDWLLPPGQPRRESLARKTAWKSMIFCETRLMGSPRPRIWKYVSFGLAAVIATVGHSDCLSPRLGSDRLNR